MDKMYNISKRQLIVPWAFLGILWSVDLGVIIHYGGENIILREFVVFWMLPFALMYYTVGWMDRRRMGK